MDYSNYKDYSTLNNRLWDVVVVGGGISGAVAAIAAARCGLNTLIIEQYGFLGGMLTAGGVGPMMSFHAGEKLVVQGITNEIIERMIKKNKSPGHVFDTTGYTYTVTPFDAEGMKHELEVMLLESGGQVLYHTMLAGVNQSEGRITSIRVCNKAGISEIHGKVFVDATGDADLSIWSGVEYTKGREQDGASMPLTMNIKVQNVNIERVRKYIKQNPDEFPRLKGDVNKIDKADRLSIGGFEITMKKAMDSGELTGVRSDLLFFETNNSGEVIVNTSRILDCDSTEPWSLSKAEIIGRQHVREIEKFLISKVAGFENCVVQYSGPSVGVRSSRQIKGVYTLTVEDLINCTTFEDVIAHGGYPVDIHPPKGKDDEEFRKSSKKIRHLQSGEIYSIPLRSLINKKICNLITVGRCISTTFEAQGGIRVTPIAGAIGHGGGVAAALAVKNNANFRDINIKEVQELLKAQGAYLEI